MKSKKRNQFINVDKNSFKGSQVLAASEMQSLGFNTNYLLGRGRTLLPSFSPDISGSTFIFNKADFATGYTQVVFYLRTTYSSQSLERVWSLGFNALSASSVIASVDDSANPIVYGSASVNDTAQQIEIFQAQSTIQTPTDISGTFENKLTLRLSGSIADTLNDRYTAFPTYIACRELDRPSFDTVSSSIGVDEDSLNFGSPVFDAQSSQYSSIVGVARNLKLAQERTYKNCLFTFARPIENSAGTSNDYAYLVTTSSLQTVGKYKAVMSPRYRNELTGTMKVFVAGGLEVVGSGWSGELIISTSAGVTTGTLKAGVAFDENPTVWKVFNVPLYRQNISSSWGGAQSGENLSLLDVDISARLSGSFIDGSEYMTLFTVQGFDTP